MLRFVRTALLVATGLLFVAGCEGLVPTLDDLIPGTDVPAGTDAFGEVVFADVGGDTCVPDCTDLVCGSDGCGGSCGDCPDGEVCSDFGQCKGPCEPDCEGRECGADGCGDVCGECDEAMQCNDEGLCESVATACGDDDCADYESCGMCPEDCGECPPECGDEECNGDETCETCKEDCGECLIPECGDSECNGDETCDACPEDCGECPLPECGDDECNGEEDCESCEEDCGECPPECGDNDCNGDETCATCPLDCGLCCGDNECDPTVGESCLTCPLDCGQCCGNQACEAEWQESCLTCPADCGQCCGNDKCDPLFNENCTTCPADCGECPGGCGDETCDDDEDCTTCPDDCGECCGDDECVEDHGENCLSCPVDCGECPPGCGNAICDLKEDCFLCPDDCGDCCGDDKCNPAFGEDCTTCPGDCGDCPAGCGDDVCDGDENCLSCPFDCGLCCGDELCDAVIGEDCKSCPDDCGDCPPACGDDECNGDEDCTSCPVDCGKCCGDEECDADQNEDCVTCPADCGSCCGDTICDVAFDEDCVNCPADCGKCCGDGQCVPDHKENCATCTEDCFCDDDAVCFKGQCCAAECDGKECGLNGCGGLCGICPGGMNCVEGLCEDDNQLTCEEAVDCILECGMNDINCAMDCQEQATDEAQELVQDLMMCLVSSCGLGMDPQCWAEALQTNCSKQWDMCVASSCKPECEGMECGPDGCGGICGFCGPDQTCDKGICTDDPGLNCNEILECALGCQNVLCVLNCQQQGTSKGTELFQELGGCLMEICQQGFDPQCWMEAAEGPCKVQYFKCTGQQCEPECGGKQCGDDGCGGSCGLCPDGYKCSQSGLCKPLPGTSCEDIVTCILQCNQMDLGCYNECKVTASPTALKLYKPLEACLFDVCLFFPIPGVDCWLQAINGECSDLYQLCVNGPCIPQCEGKECGGDGCGGSCGNCKQGMECMDDGVCEPAVGWSCAEVAGCMSECVIQDPACADKCIEAADPAILPQVMELYECVMNLCNMMPFPGCWSIAIEQVCAEQYKECLASSCEPNCAGKECGPDGCGGSCGICPNGKKCTPGGKCVEPILWSCEQLVECAMDCGADETCLEKCKDNADPDELPYFEELEQCVLKFCILIPGQQCWMFAIQQGCLEQYDTCVNGPCEPECDDKECGPDGCGGMCGKCAIGMTCNDSGKCDAEPGLGCAEIWECVLDCDGVLNCVGQCQEEGSPSAVEQFHNLFLCVMQACGPFGGDSDCWLKAVQQQCQGQLVECTGEVCEPDCGGKECGPDGCGGLCGKCPDGLECDDDGQCEEPPGLDCEGILNCILEGCANGLGQKICFKQCKEQGTPIAQELFEPLEQCLTVACLWNPQPGLTCWLNALQGECAEFHLACVNGPCLPDCMDKQCGDDGCDGTCGICPPGTDCSDAGMCMPANKSCAEIVECVMGCGTNDAKCLTKCQEGASLAALAKFESLYDCVQNFDCPVLLPPEMCWEMALEQACAKEYMKCTGPIPWPEG
jgi:hypothetical protein